MDAPSAEGLAEVGTGAPTASAASFDNGCAGPLPAGFDDGNASSSEIALPDLQSTLAPVTRVQVVPVMRMFATGYEPEISPLVAPYRMRNSTSLSHWGG